MEKNPRDEKRPNDEGQPVPRRGSPNLWLIFTLLAIFGLFLLLNSGVQRDEISYDYFLAQIRGGNVLEVKVGEYLAEGVFKEAPQRPPTIDTKTGKREEAVDAKTGEPILYRQHFRVILPHRNERALGEMTALLDEKDVRWSNAPPDNSLLILYGILLVVPLVLFFFFWMSYRRSRDQIMGGGFLSGFSKSPAKRYESSRQPITFADVAGLQGVKADLLEIVEYLQSPEKFQRLGGRVPKGVLLNGPPGTGKTLLARAVAGEAGVPFYSVNGSEFIQMFVGVGASRVRDLFKVAKENSPAIIFIDEIDAVGRQRGAGLGGGHDEREQTLNQILSEMDGFSQTDSVIIIAATNRPDVLDPALLRPGRFDRHITVGRPTLKGRIEIFKVHVRDVPLADDVDIEQLAAGTIGLTGADIRNIVNEAALWAARCDKQQVDLSDFSYARDKILMGARREEVLTSKEKEKTAYHEAGHTLTAWILPGAYRVHKVTIIPRGRSLGSTQTLPSEDRLSISERELRDQLTVLLAGRSAEKLIYQETTVGAENDLERATQLARRMVTHWGMSEQLGPVSYKMGDEDPFLGRELHQQRQFSEHTMEVIDGEVSGILHEASDRATSLLIEHRDKLDKLTETLLDREELSEQEITDLIGESVHHRASSNGRPHKESEQSPAPQGSPSGEAGPGKQSEPNGSEGSVSNSHIPDSLSSEPSSEPLRE
jgi:cell division protease FtsH